MRLVHNSCTHLLKMRYVFVYGTLKQGEPNHYLLENQTNGVGTYIGMAKTVKEFPLVIASRYNIPYVLDCPGKGLHIEGEIYRYIPKIYGNALFMFGCSVDDAMLVHLDKLEDSPVYYTRTAETFQVTRIDHNDDDQDISAGDVIEGDIYLLKNYRQELLQLDFLSKYSGQNELGKTYVKP